jgi:hypothetical protein
VKFTSTGQSTLSSAGPFATVAITGTHCGTDARIRPYNRFGEPRMADHTGRVSGGYSSVNTALKVQR